MERAAYSQNTFFHACKSITMEAQQKIFFDFLQFCIKTVAEIPASVKDADWKVMYAIAKKQALIGVLFHGIKQLPKELAPDAGLLMQWMEWLRRYDSRTYGCFWIPPRCAKSLRRLDFATAS